MHMDILQILCLDGQVRLMILEFYMNLILNDNLKISNLDVFYLEIKDIQIYLIYVRPYIGSKLMLNVDTM
jgi:hypothetical protein